MDEIRERARLAYDRALAKKNLDERMSARMMLAHAGGLWRCDQSLMSLLMAYADQTSIVILDDQSIPRSIDPRELLSAVKQRHQEIMNEWLIAYADLAKIRTAKDA